MCQSASGQLTTAMEIKTAENEQFLLRDAL